MSLSENARQRGGRHTNKVRDASPRESAGPSLSHTRRRRAGFRETPRSIRGAVFAPRDFVFPCARPALAESSQTAANTVPPQLFFQVAAAQAPCALGPLRH